MLNTTTGAAAAYSGLQSLLLTGKAALYTLNNDINQARVCFEAFTCSRRTRGTRVTLRSMRACWPHRTNTSWFTFHSLKRNPKNTSAGQVNKTYIKNIHSLQTLYLLSSFPWSAGGSSVSWDSRFSLRTHFTLHVKFITIHIHRIHLVI